MLDKYILRYIGFSFFACLMIGFFMLMFATVELNKDIQVQDRQKMKLAAVWLNDQLDTMEDIRDRISITSCFQPAYFSRNSIYELDLIQQLAKYPAHSPLIDDIRLLYVQSPRYIYGTEHKTEYNVYLQKTIQLEQSAIFTEKLFAVNDYSIFILEEHNDLIFVVYRVKMMGSRDIDSEALLWFTLRKDKLLVQMERISGLSQERVCQLRFRTIPLLDTFPEWQETFSENEWLNVTQGDLSLIIRAYHITDSEHFIIFALWGVAIIALVLTMLIVIAICVGKRSYQPIATLISRFNLSPRDEFKQIENLMNSMHRSNELSQKQIEELMENLSVQRLYLKENCILAMLDGETLHISPVQLENIGFHSEYTLFCVALLHFLNATLANGEIEEYIETAFDKNIQMLAVKVSRNQHFAIIISSNDALDLLGMDEILLDMMNSKGLTATISMGSIVHSLDDIHVSFQTACGGLYENNQTDVSVFLVGNLPELLEKTDTGKEAQALQLLNRMCSAMMENYRVRNVRQGLLMQIGNELNKLAQNYGQKDNAEELHRLLLMGRDELFVQTCREMICDISRMAQKQGKEKDSKTKELFDAIILYIDKNAYDNQLSQKSVAEHFDISERQVGRLFLDFLHLNYKEYIIQVRVDRAKELLLEGVSVTDTAMQIGYTHIPHFIKMFKERVGITPGKYKDRLQTGESSEP